MEQQKCYIVTYDLKNRRNYDNLYNALKSFIHWGKITESTWAVVSNSSAAQVRSFLQLHIDNNDRLFVIKSGYESSWINTICDNDWLKEHLVKV